VVLRWRRPGWSLLVVVFVVLPLAAVWLVDPILFSVYGNGHVISPDSPGADLVDLWNRVAVRIITVGVAALAVLLVRRVFPPLALALAAAAGALTVPWWVASLLTYLWVTGASLD
jgi:hypothetical protein